MELLWIKIDTGLHITNKRIVCPTVPQARDNVKEFPRLAIPSGMRDVFLTTLPLLDEFVLSARL